uniref:Reverse transcriptase domain-containing protein n=1 Tax=Nothobranchius furzeri TaxID=105023 RepID=A0A8C6MKE1_NOTFU
MDSHEKIYELDSKIDESLFELNINSNYYAEDQLNSGLTNNDSLSIIHINSRSLVSKMSTIKDYLGKFKSKFKVIAITETWLYDERMTEVQIEGYELHFVNRINKRGGGVALYINNDLKCKLDKKMTMMEDNVMEMVTVEIINDTSKNIIISCVYRAPGSCIRSFTDKINEFVDHIKNKTLFMCGDFNINLEHPVALRTSSDFFDMIYSLGLVPLINKPTRITTESATIIDNIFTNRKEDVVKTGILMTDISDHLPIFVVSKYHNNNKNIIKHNFINYKRNKSVKALEDLNKDLKMQNWTEVYVSDVNNAYTSFMKILLKSFNSSCKLIKITGKRDNQPWMTNGIKNACAKKNSLYMRFLKLQTKEAEDRYKKYKNKLVTIIRKQKKEYYGELLNKNKDNIKTTWGIINNVINRDNTNARLPNYFVKDNKDIYEVKEISNEFNDFFINVGRSLVESKPIIHNTMNTIPRNVNSILLDKVDQQEIRNIVKNWGSKRSTDCDDLDMVTVKAIIESVIEPFTYICNLSLSTGVFPDLMKIAKVVPLFKSGDKQSFTNYRPVSLLPQFSKILEKVFALRLDKFIDENSILNHEQYGFRTKHSTAMAVMDLVDKISSAIDNKNHFISVFIDLKKAFDVIDHSRLLLKLHRYGIRGVAHQWVNSYLRNRKQFVQINNAKSELKDIYYGVPQGSVLGPKLFILFINDLVNVSNLLGTVLFADDTTLFYSGLNIHEVTQVINSELIKVKKWFDINRLSLNLNKTNYILFNNKRSCDVSLMIDGMEIQRVKETKFLGVMFDESLTWKSHVGYIKGKIAKAIGVLYRVKFLLNLSGLLTLYHSLIEPYLFYCLEIWGATCKTFTQPLIILQKRALRIINNSNYRDHTNQLFIRYKILKFPDLVEWKILQIMYRANTSNLPTNIQKMFHKRVSGYMLKGTDVFEKPRFRTKVRECNISVNGVRLWNAINKEFKESTTLAIFKKCIKSNVFSNYEKKNYNVKD